MQIKGIFIGLQYTNETPYLIVISDNEDKLKNMLLTLDKYPEYKYVINDVKLFTFSKCSNGTYFFSRAISYQEKFIKNKIFAMNKIENTIVQVENNIVQVLLNIVNDSDDDSEEYKTFVEEIRNYKIFEEQIFSQNPIEFDKYYKDGTLNA